MDTVEAPLPKTSRTVAFGEFVPKPTRPDDTTRADVVVIVAFVPAIGAPVIAKVAADVMVLAATKA
jgi:hypothetical protein